MPTVCHYNKHSVIFSLSCASTPFYKAGWFNETSLTHDSERTASSVDLLAVSQHRTRVQGARVTPHKDSGRKKPVMTSVVWALETGSCSCRLRSGASSSSSCPGREG